MLNIRSIKVTNCSVLLTVQDQEIKMLMAKGVWVPFESFLSHRSFTAVDRCFADMALNYRPLPSRQIPKKKMFLHNGFYTFFWWRQRNCFLYEVKLGGY